MESPLLRLHISCWFRSEPLELNILENGLKLSQCKKSVTPEKRMKLLLWRILDLVDGGEVVIKDVGLPLELTCSEGSVKDYRSTETFCRFFGPCRASKGIFENIRPANFDRWLINIIELIETRKRFRFRDKSIISWWKCVRLNLSITPN